MNAFKQLDMIGFKSFADKISITFDGGITAIVGPNGCGKSNVADAIRWVLGEQSSKTLRGKNMQDIIFSGTEKRKKLSYCEVNLLFDNTGKWFNIEVDEICITRKLYRSGDSEYFINNKPCRLKDIVDMLYDCGIGRDGYSIIGQGKIDEIISSKPEDRRNIFEDAAGISKFKARKVESERRLERTHDNMTRLTDIILEIERQIEPLRKQSETAKSYLDHKQNLKNLEINAFLFQREHAIITKQEIQDKINGFNDNLTIKTNDLNNLQIKYDSNMDEVNKIDRTISNIRDDILQYTVSLEQKQGEQNVMSERLIRIRDQAERAKEQFEKYSLEKTQRVQLVEGLTNERDVEQKRLNSLHSEEQSISTRYLEVIDTLTVAEGEAENSQRAMLQNLTRLAEIKAGVSSITAKIDAINDNILTETRAIENFSRAQISNENILVQNTQRINAVQKRQEEVEKEIDDIQTSINVCEGEAIAIADELNEKKTEINNTENKIALLKNLQAEYEGYGYAVKRLLKDSEHNQQLRSSIMGVVGSVINVPEKYQTAIEMALGGAIQNIITANENEAKILVEYLKQTHAGRATFLPLSSVKSRDISGEYRRMLDRKGVMGIASELVTFDIKYKRAIDSILGSTVITDTLDNAITVARESGYSFRIVTLDGEVLMPQGSITGGSKRSNDVSILGKETEIKSLTERLSSAKNIVAELTNKQERNYTQKSKLKVLFDETTERVNSAKIELSSLNSIHDALVEKKNTILEDLSVKEKFLIELRTAISELNEKKNTLSPEELDNATMDEVDESITTRQSMYAELKARRERYNQEVTGVKIKIAETEQKIKNIDVQILAVTNEQHDGEIRLADAKAESQRQQSIYDTALNMQTDSSADCKNSELKSKLIDAESRLKNFDDFKQNIQMEIRTIDEGRSSIQTEISKLQNRVFQEDAKLQKFDVDIENMQERIFEEYSLIYDECLPFRMDSFDNREGMIEISKLKTKINSLGSINIASIEDYKTVSARYEELSAQMNDLSIAEADLVKVIKDLSLEMTTRFNVEFKKINENFKQVFKELFGGGNASLELLENADPLNAGVEIIAEPPGKKLQSITLLSGGEKALTAIAILFAILRLKAMPFCLLDEIEAALDDANVERFAKYLNRFSEQTQFIVITHRKPTMELAHSLYGVTMEEKGVSKIVSVMLDEIVIDQNEVG